MAGAAQGGGGGQSDNSAGILWSVAAIFAAIGGIWFAFKDYIILFYLSMKGYELQFLTYLSQYLTFLDPAKLDQARRAITYAKTNPNSITFPDLATIGASVGDWLRFPFFILLLVLAVVVYFSNTTRVFRRSYNMLDLAKLEKDNWPQITPIVNLDLIKEDIDKGPWAMALSPMQFCKRHKLLDEFKPERRAGMARKDWDKIDVVLKRGEAHKLFSLQLGPMWQGVDQLPDYMRALFAVFAARIGADTKAAEKIIRQISATSSGKMNFDGVDALLSKHINHKEVQRIMQAHAYVLTIMSAMLEGARADGVQASADFLWVKPKDRRLWYTLNTVGRQTPFVEVGGVFAHWVAEKEAAHRLVVPMVDEAVNALDIALKEIIYRRDEE